MPATAAAIVLLTMLAISTWSPTALIVAEDVTEKSLLETGQGAKLQPVPQNHSQLRIVSYNIRWRSGDALKKLIRLFREDPEIGGAVVLGLQEVDRNKKRSSNSNTVRLLAEELGMYYVWAAPPPPNPKQEEETGVAILSVFPLTDVKRIVLPHAGPGKRRRAAVAATIKPGGKPIRFYSVHSESRMSVDKKLQQMSAALEDLKHFPRDTPAVILGDLNTWQPSAIDKTFKLFKDAGFTTPFDEESTFCRRLLFYDFRLKLDWIWLRGLESKSHGIDKKINVSDHYPLWSVVELNTPEKQLIEIVLSVPSG